MPDTLGALLGLTSDVKHCEFFFSPAWCFFLSDVKTPMDHNGPVEKNMQNIERTKSTSCNFLLSNSVDFGSLAHLEVADYNKWRGFGHISVDQKALCQDFSGEVCDRFLKL